MSRWTAPSSATIDRVCAQPFSVVHLDMHSIWDSRTEIEAFKEDTVLLVYTLACQHFPLLLGENRFKPCSAFKDFSRDSVINCFSSLFPKIKATSATIQMWIWFYFLTPCERCKHTVSVRNVLSHQNSMSHVFFCLQAFALSVSQLTTSMQAVMLVQPLVQFDVSERNRIWLWGTLSRHEALDRKTGLSHTCAIHHRTICQAGMQSRITAKGTRLQGDK